MNFRRSGSLRGMDAERVSASRTIDAAPEAVWAVLTDPSTHAAVDGTGWVTAAAEGDRITGPGQVFRMSMFHPGHPNGSYETANLVEVYEEPRAIAWKTGTEESGELTFGGWFWRYDLEPAGDGQTRVTLTYDWSNVGPEVREYLTFPPFPDDHLANSLDRLAELVAQMS